MPSSQGTTVSFAGGAIGSLLQVTVRPGSAAITDATSFNATIVGAGSSTARIRKQQECTAIDPGGLTVRLLGMPGFTDQDIGSVGVVAFANSLGSLSAEAILETFEVECAVGDFVRGSVSFVFTGN